MENSKLYIKTPLVESIALEKFCGVKVYLKLENVQASGSYKIRGIGNFVLKSAKNDVKKLVSASGGNAGMATAYAGRKLNIPTTVVIPESTPKVMIAKLEEEKANVEVVGKVWNEAEERAVELSKEKSAIYVHPFDHPLVWEGIEPLVDEVVDQCPERISAIVLSVGGGGLLCGVLQGLQKKELDIPVVAMETEGAHCFNAALMAGKPVSIGSITSIAKTLGALIVTSRVFDLLPKSKVISEVISDKDAVNACVQFANDHQYLVEPSCGAALAAGYSGLIPKLIEEGKLDKEGAVVFIVCGGNAATLPQMEDWIKVVGL